MGHWFQPGLERVWHMVPLNGVRSKIQCMVERKKVSFSAAGKMNRTKSRRLGIKIRLELEEGYFSFGDFN